MNLKDLEKHIFEQNKSRNCMGFSANSINKKEITSIIKEMKKFKSFKEEKLVKNEGAFYKYSAIVDDNLFPYTVEIFFAKLNKEIFGSKEFFRVEIL